MTDAARRRSTPPSLLANLLSSPDMRASIDRTSLLPFYHQLKQILIADIQRPGVQPGDRLPSDHELCRIYDVSRTVVRQALSELETAGLIDRIKGRGTYVAQPKTAEGLVQSLTGLYEDVAARGGRLVSQVLRCEVVPADDAVAAGLLIDVGAPVLFLERIRFVDGQPWVLTATHIPHELAPGLEFEDFTEQSLYALLEGKYGIELRRGRRGVEASAAGAALARQLGIPRGAPVLVLRSISVGEADRPVEMFVAYHRGDRSRFEVELTRTRAPATAPLMLVLPQ